MKKTLILKTKENVVVFKGRPITLPIKETAIKSVCIELFDDADPCIIHESYAVRPSLTVFRSFDGPIQGRLSYPMSRILRLGDLWTRKTYT